MAFERTGYDYIPAPGESYDPKGEEPGETVRVIKEDPASALIEDGSGDTRVVSKSWLRR